MTTYLVIWWLLVLVASDVISPGWAFWWFWMWVLWS